MKKALVIMIGVFVMVSVGCNKESVPAYKTNAAEVHFEPIKHVDESTYKNPKF